MAQLLGPALPLQLTHGKRHWTHWSLARLGLYPTAQFVQTVEVLLRAESPQLLQFLMLHVTQTPIVPWLVKSWSPFIQSPHWLSRIHLSHPAIFVRFLLQTTQAPPLGDGFILGMYLLHSKQTSAAEHTTQLRTLQLMQVPVLVNWYFKLHLEHLVALWQTSQPFMVQLEKFPFVWLPPE